MSKALCCYAFEALVNKLNKGSTKIPLSTFQKELNEQSNDIPSSAPLFITWNKNSNLRGCIGTFQPLNIDQGVSKYSLIAAFQDPRFPEISIKELSSLSVSVTLLDNFKPIKNQLDWEIGKNGLKISFYLHNEHYSGTFLPSVAEDEGWDKLTTLYYLLKKADYSIDKKSVNDFYSKGLKEGWLVLTRYDGLKSGLSYKEFKEIRDDIE
ncbi:uncharacterized protein KGF55_001695 [Candida pseudojiufengensis]|uniref:uncharacterized protein n=1 Tax=Candida pseudojiufengensis TaxID=497109 RepID=UPI0022250498|nr:uncharacterized protein KGF55_001695 [Candida pseudojiufengensis]KAI5964626.1 hypothetical protein KGF55_001695 [Candida pseudojiufengensis]